MQSPLKIHIDGKVITRIPHETSLGLMVEHNDTWLYVRYDNYKKRWEAVTNPNPYQYKHTMKR